RAPARPDPAMSIPTPLMVEPVGLGGDVLLRNARAAQDAALASNASERPRAAGRVDTLATRPLETAVRDRRDARPEPSTSRSRVVSLVVLAGVVAVGGGVAWRARSGNERTDNAPVPTTSTSIASTASVTATTSSATMPPSTTKPAISASPPGSGALAVVPPGGGTSRTAPPTSASTASGPEKAGRSMVAFLGDPGTRVSIDGTMRGACPVRVSLEPGQHDVRFTFDPTGESRGERISVKAGEKITVRAEFTGATPTVRIQR
ncbi:MAG: eukaryotic-like serine/threonine-protein kinase, partial [Myxococcales bacterium]|nr:eukaryotic-like serine/threonine-protein kinase [Myxococcales bacterium]